MLPTTGIRGSLAWFGYIGRRRAVDVSSVVRRTASIATLKPLNLATPEHPGLMTRGQERC